MTDLRFCSDLCLDSWRTDRRYGMFGDVYSGLDCRYCGAYVPPRAEIRDLGRVIPRNVTVGEYRRLAARP